MKAGQLSAEHRARMQSRTRVAAALRALRMAEGACWLWADQVRQGVEARLDIGPTDPTALDDPGYVTALDRCAQLQQLRERAEHELGRWQITVAAEVARSAEANVARVQPEADR